MAYLKQNVSFYGTEDGFLMHLKELFTNSAFSIQLIEENYDTFPHLHSFRRRHFKVENNLKIV